MFNFGINTGLRVSDIVSLKISDIIGKSYLTMNEQKTGELNALHSDQGWHYQMKHYRHALQSRGIVQSMSRKGNYYDNSVMENFFGIMKSEFLYLKALSILKKSSKNIYIITTRNGLRQN